MRSKQTAEMSWKEPKVGKPPAAGLEGSLWSHQEDRKPDIKELLLYRTMSGLTVGPRLDPQVTSSEDPRPPSAIPCHQAPHLYRCDTSSFGPTSSGPTLMASKFSDNSYRGPREVAEAPRQELRDQKPPLSLLSESQLMPPPMGPPPPGGPGPRTEPPKVSSTTPHRDQKESIGKNVE